MVARFRPQSCKQYGRGQRRAAGAMWEMAAGTDRPQRLAAKHTTSFRALQIHIA